jgi:hypothetical protein
MAVSPTLLDRNTGFTFRGREIVLSKTNGRPPQDKLATNNKGVYSEAKRQEAAVLFAALGTYTRVSELCGVPTSTLRTWRQEGWFQSILNEVRDENNEAVDAKFTEIVHKSLEAIIDRLDNGDFVVHPKTGALVRKPVGVRDLSAINVDKRQLLRGLPTSRSETSVSKQDFDRLEKLKTTFEALANKTRPQPKIEVKESPDAPVKT